MTINNALILQARMGSSRLPEKMLRRLGDFRLLDWVLFRMSQVKRFKHRIVATSTNPLDDQIVSVARDYGFEVFRGSELDVLGRFSEVLRAVEFEFAARVCCDNPFVDPTLVDSLVDQFKVSDDLVFNHRSFGRWEIADGFGAEYFTSGTLSALNEQLCEPSLREHVTLGVYEGAIGKVCRGASVPDSLKDSGLRFDIDDEEDLMKLSLFISAEGIQIYESAIEIVSRFRTYSLNS